MGWSLTHGAQLRRAAQSGLRIRVGEVRRCGRKEVDAPDGRIDELNWVEKRNPVKVTRYLQQTSGIAGGHGVGSSVKDVSSLSVSELLAGLRLHHVIRPC